jgi:hypothetical protein
MSTARRGPTVEGVVINFMAFGAAGPLPSTFWQGGLFGFGGLDSVFNIMAAGYTFQRHTAR